MQRRDSPRSGNRRRGSGRSLRALFARLTGRGRPDEDRDLDQELAFHLEMETEKYVQQGMSRSEARRLASIRFGAMERAKEECREERRGSHLDMLIQDIRYALRTLGRNPGFSVAAVLTLALGIGANAAIFSVIYGVLLRPLPYRDGHELVLIQPESDARAVQMSIKEVHDYREQTSSFENIVEWHQMFFILLGRGEPERVNTSVVSDNFFDTLGVTPLHGRTFVDGEDELDAEPVLVLSHGYWQRAFGSDPGVVGQVFEMNNRPHTVVGVLPPIPQFPTEADVYMPTSACPFRANGEQRMHENRGAFRNLVVFARLADDVELSTADAEANGVAQRFQADFPDDYPPDRELSASVVDLKSQLTSNARPMMLMLLATAGLVLLIACANVANLTLARVIRREREIAVRAALGAGRGRLLRQLVTESTLLSLLGGAAGLVLAYVSLDLLIGFAARFTPRATDIEMDVWVLAFTLAVSLGTGIFFGSTPVMASRQEIAGTIREAGRGSDGNSKHTLRKTLIVAQVALSFMLLIGAGLMLRSLVRLQEVDPGFDTEQVLSARVSMNWSAYATQADAQADYDLLVRRLGESPFARAAALTSKAPYRSTNPFSQAFIIEGRPVEETQVRTEMYPNSITEDYFEVLGIPVVAGRAFDNRDQVDSAPVAIVSQSMADRYWSEEDPVGARVSVDGGDSWIEIVGVVGDTKLYGPDRPAVDEFYRPAAQAGIPFWVLVRTVGDPAAASEQLKEVVYSVSTTNPISDLAPMATLRDDAVSSPRLTAVLLGVFALLALAVTVTGIAGVMAFSVSQRTHELGIRMALGARKSSVLQMVMRQGMALVLVGLAVGVVGALAFGRVLAELLYETAPTDLTTYALVSLCLLAAALAACFLPARRATAVDPMIALRND